MRAFRSGVISCIIIGIGTFLILDVHWLIRISGGIGIVSLVVSGIISGLLSSNIYRYRATQTDEERIKKVDLGMTVFFFSIPYIICFLITAFTVHYNEL